MYAKVYAAFGHVMQRTFIDAQEKIEDKWVRGGVLKVDGLTKKNIQIMEGNEFVWFIAQGKHVHTNVATGERKELNGGWCSLLDPLPVGEHMLTIPVYSESVCLAAELSGQQTLPEVTHFALGAGESKPLPNGTKLYLVEGEIEVNGKVIPGMRQVRISSGDSVVKGLKDSFGLIFH